MLIAIVLFLGFFNIATSSDLATFNDRKCAASLDSINGPNGYPNGTCTALNVKTSQSFQIVGLDPGCAVTLYGPDTTSDPCSADILIVGKIGTCYNATWEYYSIDGCNIPSVTPSPTPLPKTSSSIPPSSSSTSTSISTSTLASSTPVSSASATASPSPSLIPEKNNHLPLIVGATLGGVGVVALIAIAALLFVRRRKSNMSRPDPPTYELSNDRALLEATSGEKAVQTELWAHDGAQEIGRNSIHVPPVELEGNSAGGEDKKNINPLIKIHMAR